MFYAFVATAKREFPLRNDFFHHSVRFTALNVKNTLDVISHKRGGRKNFFLSYFIFSQATVAFFDAWEPKSF
jgi:hypothetical protein